MIVQVLLPLPFETPFDYEVPKSMDVGVGDYVRVPFGKRLHVGIVWATEKATAPRSKIRLIAEAFDLPPMSDLQREFIQWTANYTLTPVGMILKMALSSPEIFKTARRARKEFVIPAPNAILAPPLLSKDQKNAAEELIEAVKAEKFAPFVLDGVTGSGKTEVYLSAVQEALKNGKQALIMMPEITLTHQFLDRFTKRFGVEPVLWHSNLTPAQRRAYWHAIVTGEAKVVAGARSSLMLPYRNLGLVVVDEEHDPSYKQEEGIFYNARDMAVVRGKLMDHPVALVSATPSLETLHNAELNRYKLLHLPERHASAQLPSIDLIDLRSNPAQRQRWLSEPLRAAIRETLAQGEQALLFLNRRGYAPLTLCRGCGNRLQCPQCSAWLVEHRHNRQLMCHHCGITTPKPSICAKCDAEDKFAPCGPGVERIEEEVKEIFPDARHIVLASDTKNPEDVLHAIQDHKVDIIIGTQLIAKGHHFPSITLVGVVDGDLGLTGADLRAGERTFQLLHQVSGRAGRESRPGRVFIQTYDPSHPVMQALKNNNRAGFLKVETDARLKSAMPPFGKLAALIVASKDAKKLDKFCFDLASNAPHDKSIRVLGPAPAPLAMLRGYHRRRFLLKSAVTQPLQPYLHQWLSPIKIPPHFNLDIDIDPMSFY